MQQPPWAWRGIATRYEKTATIYLAGLHIGASFGGLPLFDPDHSGGCEDSDGDQERSYDQRASPHGGLPGGCVRPAENVALTCGGAREFLAPDDESKACEDAEYREEDTHPNSWF
ncbi:hypothetical protein ACPCSQ_03760 [Streptomyces griseoincarnatus]|nr:hypothetical protein [Actinospica acidiphila]